MKFTKRMFLIALAVSSASLNMYAGTLTGAVAFNANSSGDYAGGVVSTSTCCQGFFLSQGSTSGTFVANVGSDDLGLTLNPGTYSFYGFTDSFNVGYGALNLFFNGDTVNPGISVYGLPTNDSTVFPAYSADSSTNTPNESLAGVAGSGSLVYNDGTNTISLTNFQWANASAYNLDRVNGVTTSPDTALDTVVRFDLNVVSNSEAAPAPEPASLMLLGGGLTAIFFARRKKA